ncbi:MAG: septum formation protein Maf [Muribaculaceae bacterium]|nr:septum formation protein Maf [Muribaculaceae bacterium]
MSNPLQKLIDRYEIVLASGSPRRRELLGMLDIPFRVDTSHSVDEIVPAGMPPHEVPGYLSRLKAGAYPISEDSSLLVIAADTVVVLDGEVLGKPSSAAEARAMLGRLAGKTQTVVTGVTIRTAHSEESWSSESEVTFGALTEEEIDYYVDKYSPLDKAGAYGVQEWIGAAAIREIKGSFYNVMGLPVHRLYAALRSIQRAVSEARN